MTETTLDKRILSRLADVAGERFQEDDITFEGTRLVIPEKMTVGDAIGTLGSYLEAQEAVTEFSRVFKYRPYDGAAAFARAIKTLTGTAGIGKGTFSFFGYQHPQVLTVPTNVTESLQVPWGAVEIPLFGGTADIGYTGDPELGPVFRLTVTAPKKHKAPIEGLFRLIEEELQTNSIYRGKAFNGAEMPDFVDLRGVERDKVIYSDQVVQDLNANIWSLLRHTETMRKNGLPLKRSVLLHGPYGTGKTLAAFLTAMEAIENGWSFVYCRPGKDDLERVMQTARLYQPSVVFFEDVDTISQGDGSSDSVTSLLDMFDGINAKGTELMAVLTTNHPEKIHKGMVRPGRLDAVIEIGALDSQGIEKMIHSIVPEDKLELPLEMEAIAESMDEFLPAFVKEAIDRAVRYSIARRGGEVGRLASVDFVNAAHGLRPQLDMMNGAGEGKAPDRMESIVSGVVRSVVDQSQLVGSSGVIGKMEPTKN